MAKAMPRKIEPMRFDLLDLYLDGAEALAKVIESGRRNIASGGEGRVTHLCVNVTIRSDFYSADRASDDRIVGSNFIGCLESSAAFSAAAIGIDEAFEHGSTFQGGAVRQLN